MKKCPYCDKEYSDEVERCLIDNEILLEADIPASSSASDAISKLPIAVSPTVWTERQLQIFEVVLVCLIAFGTAILSSSYSLLFGSSENSPSPRSNSETYRWIYSCLREAPALGLVWYLLQRRGKTFTNLGLTWAGKDIAWSIILRIGGWLAFYTIFYAIYYTGLTRSNLHTVTAQVGHILFSGGISYAVILFQCLNPFFEELIVRAYLMTAVKQLTGSMTKAIILSTVIQTSYHFYQGVPAALAHGGTFLLFSIYYAKTNRIAPVILAHLYSDVGSTLWYFWRQ